LNYLNKKVAYFLTIKVRLEVTLIFFLIILLKYGVLADFFLYNSCLEVGISFYNITAMLDILLGFTVFF
jgi:hypothetical protein